MLQLYTMFGFLPLILFQPPPPPLPHNLSKLKLFYLPRGFPSSGPDLLVNNPHVGEIFIIKKFSFVS